MTKAPVDPRSLARSFTEDAFEVLLAVISQDDAPWPVRVSAALAIIERGWGKPTQPPESEISDERPPSELTTAQLVARVRSILERVERGAGGADAGEAGVGDVRERDRDPGSAGPA
jgi:hypothetical protein